MPESGRCVIWSFSRREERINMRIVVDDNTKRAHIFDLEVGDLCLILGAVSRHILILKDEKVVNEGERMVELATFGAARLFAER